MRLTIDFDITNRKALALIDYLRTLDFINIQEKDELKEYSLTDDQIVILRERKQRHLAGESESYDWESLKNEFNAK